MPCLIIGTSLAVFSSGLDEQVEILTSNKTETPPVQVGILLKCAMPYNRHFLVVFFSGFIVLTLPLWLEPSLWNQR